MFSQDASCHTFQSPLCDTCLGETAKKCSSSRGCPTKRSPQATGVGSHDGDQAGRALLEDLGATDLHHVLGVTHYRAKQPETSSSPHHLPEYSQNPPWEDTHQPSQKNFLLLAVGPRPLPVSIPHDPVRLCRGR